MNYAYIDGWDNVKYCVKQKGTEEYKSVHNGVIINAPQM